jgi:hypothetical protein
MLAVSALGLCGSLTHLYGDDQTSSQNCMYSPEEQSFGAQLYETNQSIFFAIKEEKMADCKQIIKTTEAY